MSRRSRIPLSLLVTVSVWPLLAAPAAAHGPRHHRALGDSRVVFRVPSTGYPGDLGYPEGLVIIGNRGYVSTPATFGTAGSAASKIYGFDVRTGDLERTYVITGQDLSQEHALSGMTVDGRDRLYVLDTQLGVLRLSANGHTQETYATFPDLPATAHGDLPPLPNDLCFDDDGNLYVTDTLQGVIYRVPPGGGPATVWFQDPRLDTPFGPNGIRVSPDRTRIVFAVTIDDLGVSTLYSLPLVAAPTAADLQVFHVYAGGEGPDAINFAASGDLYVTLAYSNQISVLDENGNEITRYQGPAADGCGATIPWDAPASFAFDNRQGRILVANHALFSGVPDHFVVFDVYVDDRVDPQPEPRVP